MNLSDALLPGVLVFVIIAGIDQALGKTLTPKLKVPLAFVLGVIFVFCVAASDFGSEQLVQDKPLDVLNGWSLLIVGLLVGATAVGIDQSLKAVKNLGQNQP